MKIQFASDLHLEFNANSEYLANNPLIPCADILVLAGDIGYLEHPTYTTHPFWDWAADNFKRVLVIPGNHEFYKGYDLKNIADGMKVPIRSNIHWYYNKTEVIDGTEFIMTTLWSHIPDHGKDIIRSRVSDFHCIQYDGHKLTTEKYNDLHRGCLEFLKSAITCPVQNGRVIISHHVPSLKCVAKEFHGSDLNWAFNCDLDSLIAESEADYWIYGHSHRNIGYAKAGVTKLFSNQLGYVFMGENRTFNPQTSVAVSNSKRPVIKNSAVPNVKRILFWDTDFDRIDWQRYKNAVIERVLDRGDQSEKEEIARFYNEDVNDLEKFRISNNSYRINALMKK